MLYYIYDILVTTRFPVNSVVLIISDLYAPTKSQEPSQEPTAAFVLFLGQCRASHFFLNSPSDFPRLYVYISEGSLLGPKCPAIERNDNENNDDSDFKNLDKIMKYNGSQRLGIMFWRYWCFNNYYNVLPHVQDSFIHTFIFLLTGKYNI